MAFLFKRRKNLIHFTDSMASQVKGGFPLILGALSLAQTDATLLANNSQQLGVAIA